MVCFPRSCANLCDPFGAQHLRYASRKYWEQIARDIGPVYTAPTEAAAKERFVEFTTKWGAQYPAIIRLWENAWSEFVPFLDYVRRGDPPRHLQHECDRVDRCPLPARDPRPRAFPTEQAAMKCLYLVTRSLDPTGRGKARWAMRWKPALNAFRDHLQRPDHPDRQLTNAKVRSTVNQTVPVQEAGRQLVMVVAAAGRGRSFPVRETGMGNGGA
jgi:transposase-like protein